MAWSGETTGNTTDVNSIIQFTTGNTITPGGLHEWVVDFNPPATPTDNLVISVYGAKGTTGSPEWDDIGRFAFTIDPDTDPNQASFTIAGMHLYRIGFELDGATDTGDVDWSFFDDGINL